MARRKAPRQEAPQTIEEATVLAGRYIELLDEISLERLDAQKSIDMITATRDKVIAQLEEEAKGIFRQLRPWWASNRQELTQGKRKSIELAGAVIGERTTTPKLSPPKGMKLGGLVEWLLGRNLVSLIRTKHEVDKPACIKALRAVDAPEPGLDAPDADVMEHKALRAIGEQLAEKGASVSQRDEFFIDRAGRKEADPQTVDVEDEGGAS